MHPVVTLEPSSSQPPVVSITADFAELKDPRLDRTKAHALLDILVIAICAIIRGANDWEAVAEFDRSDEARLRKGHSAQNFAILRHIAFNLLKQETTSS